MDQTITIQSTIETAATEETYYEVNYVTPEHASLCVYAGTNEQVVKGLTSQENIQFLATSTRVLKVTVIKSGGHIETTELQSEDDCPKLGDMLPNMPKSNSAPKMQLVNNGIVSCDFCKSKKYTYRWALRDMAGIVCEDCIVKGVGIPGTDELFSLLPIPDDM